jgi:uncharacterized protein
LRYKIKDIPAAGLLCDQALERALLAEALDGVSADLDRTAGAVHLELTRAGDEVYVRGKVVATVSLPCGLCLGPARVDVDSPVKMVYVRDTDDEDEDDDETAADELDDEDFGHHDGEWVDLAPMVREQLILALPMVARCKEGCRGLCPTCGQDLNEKDCGHKESHQPSAFNRQLQAKLNPKADG